MQAWCTIQALLVEIDSNKADCFGQFPAYIKRYKAADNKNYIQLKLSERGNFEAVFFCSIGCIQAASQLRLFIAVDGIYTRSKYQMQLIIACSIDTNNNSVLQA
jgi:hypothetical protein